MGQNCIKILGLSTPQELEEGLYSEQYILVAFKLNGKATPLGIALEQMLSWYVKYL